MPQINANSSLSDYGKADDESLEEFAEFSPKYQAFRLYRTCLQLQATQQYPRARKTFYDNLGWFTIMFDPVFPQRCYDIIQKYESREYVDAYTYEQIEQVKFMRITVEFSRMLIDASSKNKVKFNVNPKKRVELIPVGYAQVLNYEHMSIEFFNRLTQIQQQQSHRDAVKFFNHSLGWFGGIFDAKFVMQGYLIDQTESNPELRFRKLVSAFSKLLTLKSITPTAFATLVYKPKPGAGTPITVDDVVKAKGAKPADISASAERARTKDKPPETTAAKSLQREQLAAMMRAATKISEEENAKKEVEQSGQEEAEPVSHARAPDGGPLLTVDDVNEWNDRKMKEEEDTESQEW